MRIAAAQYPIDYLADWAAYRAKLDAQVAAAGAEGAELLVFPEYASMELASLLDPQARATLAAQLQGLQPLLGDYLSLHAELAKRYAVHLLAGSFPCRVGDRYVNRAHLFSPSGACGHQDKLVMTRFENEEWHISAGGPPRVFNTSLGTLAVAICYDIEFPPIARCLAEAGARILLVPSCTDTLAGFHRVRVGAQARALENQCYVVQSPTVGEAPWSAAVDINVGAAAVYAPPDHGFPADGLLAAGAMDRPQWLFADLDLAALERVREEGQVFNDRDWPLAVSAAGTVESVDL